MTGSFARAWPRRLIRSKDDCGHFIVLSSAFPTRLTAAFPPDTPVLRLTLEETLHRLAASALLDRHPDHAAREDDLR